MRPTSTSCGVRPFRLPRGTAHDQRVAGRDRCPTLCSGRRLTSHQQRRRRTGAGPRGWQLRLLPGTGPAAPWPLGRPELPAADRDTKWNGNASLDPTSSVGRAGATRIAAPPWDKRLQPLCQTHRRRQARACRSPSGCAAVALQEPSGSGVASERSSRHRRLATSRRKIEGPGRCARIAGG